MSTLGLVQESAMFHPATRSWDLRIHLDNNMAWTASVIFVLALITASFVGMHPVAMAAFTGSTTGCWVSTALCNVSTTFSGLCPLSLHTS